MWGWTAIHSWSWFDTGFHGRLVVSLHVFTSTNIDFCSHFIYFCIVRACSGHHWLKPFAWFRNIEDQFRWPYFFSFQINGPLLSKYRAHYVFFAVACRWGASIIGIEILRNPNLAKIFDIGIQNVHEQWPTPKFPVPRNDVPQMLKSGDFDGVRSKHCIGTHFQIILVLATQWVVTFWGFPSKIIVWASNLGFYMV